MKAKLCKQSSASITQMPVVIGTGLVALDVIMSGDGTRPPQYHAGGTCGNVLSILSYLNWSAYPVTRLRPGAAADEIRADLLQCGVKTEFLAKKKDGSTPIVVQRIGKDRAGRPYHRFLWTCPDCNAFLPGYKPILAEDAHEIGRRLPGAQVFFFFDRVSRGTLVLARACAEKGAVVVFEPSGIGDPRLFSEAIRISHVLKYSRERISHIDVPTGKLKPLLEIETLGEGGLRFRSTLSAANRKAWHHLEAFPVRRLRDSAGSGDWCTAGIMHVLGSGGLAGLQESTGGEVVDAIRYGQALATWNCEYEGTRGGMYNTSIEKFDRAVRSILLGSPLSELVADETRRGTLRSVCPSCRRAGKITTKATVAGTPSRHRLITH